jgi:hypothetical protein
MVVAADGTGELTESRHIRDTDRHEPILASRGTERNSQTGSPYHACCLGVDCDSGSGNRHACGDGMTNNLSDIPDDGLRVLMQNSRQTLASLIQSLHHRPDMQNAIRRLMSPDDMLETLSGLAVKEPDLMRPVLQGSVAAMRQS